jgi:hypothetical protein
MQLPRPTSPMSPSINGSDGSLRVIHKSTHRFVSQDMLRQYKDLKILAEQKEELRKQILKLLEAGACVEQGPLSAEVRSYEQRLLNAKTLMPILGEHGVQDLKDSVEPTVVNQLWVS